MDSFNIVDPPVDGSTINVESLFRHLSITDPEVVQTLIETRESIDHKEHALAALRIGIMSLKEARGTVGGAAVRGKTFLAVKAAPWVR